MQPVCMLINPLHTHSKHPHPLLQDNHHVGTHGPVAVGVRCQPDGTVALSLCVVSHEDAPPDTPPRPSAWGVPAAPAAATPRTATSVSFAEIARKAERAAATHQSSKQPPVIMPAPAIAPRTPTQAAPRVVTGTAVTKQYQDARGAARDLARLRNMCFMQATQAYLAGNKALAKELGARGRAYNEEMKAAHAAASGAIFRTRNATNPQGFIDLHGLHVKVGGWLCQGVHSIVVVTLLSHGIVGTWHRCHMASLSHGIIITWYNPPVDPCLYSYIATVSVSSTHPPQHCANILPSPHTLLLCTTSLLCSQEALDVLDRELGSNHHKQASSALQICVGTGSHTKGSRTPARLPAAVERYLNERRMPFSYVIPGLIELEPMH